MMFSNVSRSRLLPMSLPFRFFGAATGFQIAAWALLLAHSKEVLSFEAGLGPVFASLHLLTLGVLAMVAIGATLQLLPVATRQPVRALWAVKLAWWLLVPGVAAFTAAAASYRPDLMGPGAMAVTLALAVYAVLLFLNLRNARGMRVVVMHGWAALACLVALAATGIALVARYEHGLALDHAAFRSAHVALAAYGFMGLLAVGLSQFLLPMLALAPPPPPRTAMATLSAAAVAIVLASFGLTDVASLLGLAAAAIHVYSMERSLKARLRSPLGSSFLLVRVSWACLLASLALAALGFPGGTLLFGLVLVPGWLLTFLLGVMQRILPFLASVHASTAARGMPLISAMTPARLLGVHAALHVTAVVLLMVSTLTNLPWLVRAGAAAGLAAAAAFALFYGYVLAKVRTYGNACPPSQPAPA
ncbi:MAG TPA: hypothetical protein VFR66_00925 [Burkholderiales bacterium]|nr:hypothetical protein [Burkholderiales bacterium]